MNKFILILLFIFFIFSVFDISYQNIDENKYINVEVRGEVYNEKIIKIRKNSVFQDILEYINLKPDADLSSISLNSKLYHNQIIVIPAYKEFELISINSSSVEELSTLPGIGHKTAENIIEYRKQNGGFTELLQLKEVKGIGDKKYEAIKEYICL